MMSNNRKGLVLNLVQILIILVVVIALGMLIVGRGNFSISNQQKKLASFFEYEMVHPQSGPTQEFVNIECEGDSDNYVVKRLNLTGMSFDYTGKERKIEFVIYLDIGDKLRVGEYEENGVVKQKITCLEDDAGNMQCDQPRNYYFDVTGITGIKERDYFHFTVWRYDLYKNIGQATTASLSMILQKWSMYYLASFGVGGFVVDEKCRDYICTQKEYSDCSQHGCYWKSGFLFGGTCKACPISTTKCSMYDEEQCKKCQDAIANCKLFGGSCKDGEWVLAEEKCVKFKETNTQPSEYLNACHAKASVCLKNNCNCWFRSSDKQCHVCVSGLKCGKYEYNDCDEANICGLNCIKDNVNNKCVENVATV